MNIPMPVITTQKLASKILTLVATASDACGHLPISKLSILSDNHPQILSAYELLEKNGYLTICGQDVVLDNQRKNNSQSKKPIRNQRKLKNISCQPKRLG